MTRETALSQSAHYFDSGQFEAELSTLVSYPTESQGHDSQPVLLAYLSCAIMPRLMASVLPVGLPKILPPVVGHF